MTKKARSILVITPKEKSFSSKTYASVWNKQPAETQALC